MRTHSGLSQDYYRFYKSLSLGGGKYLRDAELWEFLSGAGSQGVRELLQNALTRVLLGARAETQTRLSH
ncbi:MAG: hypothetical protein HOI66_10215 [Verrucomicrobia bacterium]|nr:hypothetical protein [Verrucomicrobiota bacterium]MDB4796842.1 hypothetical protein [bacterium]